MSIELHCNHCGKLVKAPDEAAGKHGKCPSCHQMVYIPTPSTELETFDLAPVDTEFERRKQKLMEETHQLTKKILMDREGLPPEKPGDRAERLAAQERASAERATTERTAARGGATISSGQANDLVIRYAVAVAGGDVNEAEKLSAVLRQNHRLMDDAIQRVLSDEIPPPQLEKIPRALLVGIFKKLREA